MAFWYNAKEFGMASILWLVLPGHLRHRVLAQLRRAAPAPDRRLPFRNPHPHAYFSDGSSCLLYLHRHPDMEYGDIGAISFLIPAEWAFLLWIFLFTTGEFFVSALVACACLAFVGPIIKYLKDMVCPKPMKRNRACSTT